MTSFKTCLLALLVLFTTQAARAQANAKVKAKGPTPELFQMKTSAVCDMCKARLEKSLAYEKGVQEATLDVPSKVLTVAYRPDKTTPAALRAAVQRTGYDADGQPADQRAYDRLPDCCKKTSAEHSDAK